MIIDGNQLAAGERHYDLCIVGSGPAGVTIAQRLRHSGLNICVIEAGDRQYSETSQAFYQGAVTAENYEPLDVVRLRLFGGTSGHWAGYCAELDPLDFERRAWIPDSGWPIPYAAVSRYYPAAREILDIPVLHARPPTLDQDNPQLHSKLWEFSPPTRFSEKYEHLFSRPQQPDLYLNTAVTRISLDGNRQRAAGITAKTSRGQSINFVAPRYVLACGGIETPRLLLTANPAFRQGPGGQHIGAYFMEHPHFLDVAQLMLFDNSETRQRLQAYERQVGRLMYALQLSAGAQQSMKLNNMACVLRPAASAATELRELPLFGNVAGALTYSVVVMLEQRPHADSRVTLTDDKDANGIPRAELQWRTRSEDYTSCYLTLQKIAHAVGASGLGRMRISLEDLQGDGLNLKYWGHHHMGTTRMSADARSGVVDPNCRMHGIDNLYIAGSSVFPTGGCVNPTFSIVALALRLADHLASSPDQIA